MMKNIFEICRQDAERVLSEALCNGGTYADLYFEHTITNELVLKDNKISAVASNIDFGVGVRVLKGERTGYAYSETTDMESMLRAAKTAAQIADSPNIKHREIKISKEVKADNHYPLLKGWDETDITYKIKYLDYLNEQILKKGKYVEKANARIADSISDILFFNSLGETFYDIRPLVSISAGAVLLKKERRENGSVSRSFRCGFELLSESLMDEIADELISRTEILFDAIQPKGGIMSVVMGAGGSGILLHEAVGHAFEADFNRKGASIFSDKMGKKVCDSSINIVDDGTLLANRGSCNWDDEGVPGQKTYMVKDGILNSYLHDRISAHYYKVQPTGNGRRESFRYMPIPRMRATYMEAGPYSNDEIIKSVKKGIYVDNFSNGQVQIGAGDFTFFVKSGYLIENGTLTAPIKDINIIGNGPQALADITMVGNNPKMENATWICGKDQLCPVSCGMPTVKVNQLMVGGL